jgi:hypothetical protein
MTRKVDETEFAALVAQSGLPLDEAQKRVLFEMYSHLVPMIDRVCGDRPRDAEPALVFAP